MKNQTQTFQVQAILGDRFEDVYVEARTEAEALKKARKVTTLRHRFTQFVLA